MQELVDKFSIERVHKGGAKFDFEKDWKIDKEFLELHTKDQLQDLMKELKVDLGPLGNTSKKDELVDVIIKAKIVGKVPKIMKV